MDVFKQGGVANLCVDKSMAKLPAQKLTFTDRVPSTMAGAQKYRIVVDYTNMVDESNESNNIGGTRYLPWEESFSLETGSANYYRGAEEIFFGLPDYFACSSWTTIEPTIINRPTQVAG